MTITDLPKAYIKHQLSGRVRLKIPKKRGNYQYFDKVADVLADCEGITQLQLNPSSASLLIQHGPGVQFSSIAAFACSANLFNLIDAGGSDQLTTEHLSIAGWSSVGVTQLDQTITQVSGGRFDLRSMLFLTFVGLGVREATRGHVMAPAATFLWRALELLNAKNENMYGTSKK